jgi:type I restriction enzyme, S subunit
MELKEGYKMTEVGVIPEDWEVKHGYELAEKITKGASPRWQGFAYQDSGVLFVTSENVRNGKLDVLDPKFLPFSFWDKQKNSQLKKGDLLINIVGASIGKACVYDLDLAANINQAVCLFRASEKVNRSFLLYFFQAPHIIEKLLGNQTESARPNLSLSDIRFFLVALPTLAEQTAIATVLSDMDALITSLEQLIAKKRSIKQGVMQELLTGKRRLPGFGGDKYGYKMTEVGPIPEDWEVDKIEHYATISTGGKNTQDKIDDGEYPFFVRSQTVERINSYSFDGEAVLTAGDGVGTGKIFHYIIGKFDVHQRVYLMSNFSEKLDGYFFYLVFSSNFLKRIMSMTAKSSVDSVRRNMIADMFIPIPPTLSEQKAIANALKEIDEETSALTQKLTKLQLLKQGMMQNLLTGKIRLI